MATLTFADLKPGPKPAAAPPSPKSPPQAKSPPPAESKPEKPKGPAYTPPLLDRAAKKRERDPRWLEKHGVTFADVDAVTLQLMEKYPDCFNFQRRPLAIGIDQTILADLGCNEYALAAALSRWCSNPGYLKRLAELSSYRHHLDGTRSSELTEADRAAAKHRLERLKARRAG
jgi:hypothetical protein